MDYDALLPKIDTTELEDDATCYLVGTNTIYAFRNNNRVRTEYHIFNDKLYKYYVNNYNYSYDITNYNCLSYQDILQINSTAQNQAPIYYLIAFIFACLLLWIPYKVLVHPWWRRL